jgi:hypothetical protein
VAQELENLLSEREALSSNPSPTKKNKINLLNRELDVVVHSCNTSCWEDFEASETLSKKKKKGCKALGLIPNTTRRGKSIFFFILHSSLSIGT